MALCAGAAQNPSVLFIGDYKILLDTTLGSGSNACVRLAQHLPSGKKVASKIVKICKETCRERAYLEAQVLRTLKGTKNIINLLDVIERGKYLYLFLDYMPCGDLSSFVNRSGALPEGKARNFFKQIIHALEHCHNNNIAHHDVKLDNMLLGNNFKKLNLIDFGLCSRIPPTKLIHEFSGSPLYMAPEIFSLQPHSEIVDVWSAGVCLYKMTTDLFPFLADSYSELEEKVLFEDVFFPVSGFKCLSEDLKDLIRKMLTKDPKQRITIEEIKNHPWIQNKTNKKFRLDKNEKDKVSMYYNEKY